MAQKRRRQQARKNGRAGGIARKSGKESRHKMVPCEQCGKEIDARNKTGMCVVCLRKARAANKKKEKSGTCKRCGDPVNPRNKTGYCRDCYRTSHLWEEQHAAHANWVSVNVCEEDAKTRQTQRT